MMVVTHLCVCIGDKADESREREIRREGGKVLLAYVNMVQQLQLVRHFRPPRRALVQP